MALAVGIDLGTTNSAVAMLDDHGRPVVVRNGDGDTTTPSVVCFRDGDVRVGAEAREMQGLGPPVADFFKRQMGDRYFVFPAGGRDYKATDLAAIVLRKLKSDAEATVGQPISHAVITVPAYFRNAERIATIEAGQAAGLDVLQVINEPTAAAIAYGAGGGAGGRILVYDLGGGTFDVTLLELVAGELKVKCSDGDHHLGGKDWDDAIVEFLSRRFKEQFGVDPRDDLESWADLRTRAEAAKMQLSARVATRVAISHGGNRGRYELTRQTFEELTRNLLDRTMSLVTSAVEDVRLGLKDIGRVLLVGGSTRMPAVRRRIEEECGRPPMGNINEDEAVALGAAIVAAERFREQTGGSRLVLPGVTIKTTDVTSHSLGMIAVNVERSAYINSVVLPKNTEIPCEETRPFQQRTRRGGNNQVEVFVTQGESERPDEVAYVNKYVVKDIPHQPSGVSVVDVTYRYDHSGTVEVAASARESGARLPVVMEDLPDDVPTRFLDAPDSGTERSEHVTVYLVFDLSYSMGGEPLREAQKAARRFLRNTDLGHCSLGVIVFSDDTKTTLDASQNARSIERAIDDLETEGTTAARRVFAEIRGRLTDVEGRRFAIVLTDGEWFNPEVAELGARRCHQHGIDVIAIGFGDADEAFLRAIASSDEVSLYTRMSKLVDTFSTIAQVLTETGGELGSGGFGSLSAI